MSYKRRIFDLEDATPGRGSAISKLNSSIEKYGSVQMVGQEREDYRFSLRRHHLTLWLFQMLPGKALDITDFFTFRTEVGPISCSIRGTFGSGTIARDEAGHVLGGRGRLEGEVGWNGACLYLWIRYFAGESTWATGFCRSTTDELA